MKRAAKRATTVLLDTSGKGSVAVVVGTILAGVIAILLVQVEQRSTKNREKRISDLRVADDSSRPAVATVVGDKSGDIGQGKRITHVAEEYGPIDQPKMAKTKSQGENEYRSDTEGSSWAADPFPMLKTFEKVVNRLGFKERTEDSFRHTLHHAFSSGKLRTKLIDLTAENYIRFNVDKTYWFRSELTSHHDGRFIFQDEKVFSSMNDGNLRTDLPLCIVQIEKSQDSHAHYEAEVSLMTRVKKHPIDSVRNFRGVRIQSDRRSEYDLGIRSIECGFISDMGPTDDYLRLELVHLYATIGFDKVPVP